MSLSKQQKKLLRKASGITDGDLFFELRRHWASNKWIGKTNRYYKNCVNRIEKDTKKSRINHDHLAEYIAASVLLHTSDGWGFLGRAIDCHARGDFRTSRHLAYYAELRAAMALSAYEGIGIFNKEHFVIDSSHQCHQIPQKQGTHQIAWLIFNHWSNLKRSSDLITSVIKPGGIGLGEWTERFGGGITVRAVGGRWLKAWGIDLKKLSKDRNARNEASYRPSKLAANKALPFDQLFNFIIEFWRIFEPTAQNSFDLLDRFLLRLCLSELFKGITGSHPRDNMVEYRERISRMLEGVLGQQSIKEKWLKFLTWEIEPNDADILIEAMGADRQGSPRHHLQVIARGTLLLRLSTGACEFLLSSTGVDRGMIEFWLKAVGEEIGMWETDGEPEELTDLWSDIQLATTEIKDWYTKKDLPSLVKWRKEQGSQISILGNCERIGLWGLGI